jgi:hypothetical protein
MWRARIQWIATDSIFKQPITGDPETVIASEAKQSMVAIERKYGLLRCARNDGKVWSPCCIDVGGGSGSQSQNRPRISLRSIPSTISTVVIARSEATKQSRPRVTPMDCFAEPVIERALARPVGSQ